MIPHDGYLFITTDLVHLFFVSNLPLKKMYGKVNTLEIRLIGIILREKSMGSVVHLHFVF